MGLAIEIKNNAVIADVAMDFLPEVEAPDQWNVLNRYHEAGFSYLNIALGGDLTSVDTAIHYIARQRHTIEQYPDRFIMVNSVEDILRSRRENKLALGFWFQGSTPLAKDIHLIEVYYLLGIRQILLTYNTRNEIGDGILEIPDAGLSQFGYRVIEEMNRVGMLVDISHSGIKTSLDIIQASQDPVLFSHSNVKGIHPHVRNLTDEQIRAIAQKQGLIGISGAALLLGQEKPTVEKLVDHIDYINQLVGSVDCVALGLDFIHFQTMLPLFFEKAALKYPKGYLGSMEGLPPECIEDIIEALLKRKYSIQDTEKILGGNFLRLASAVWK